MKLILSGWVKGFNTNNWNSYIKLLSDNYIFNIPSQHTSNTSTPHSIIELFNYLKDRGVEKITTEPVRIVSNDYTVVFEFEEPTNQNDGSYLSFALSFDYEKGVIINYREYFGNNIK